MPKARGRTDVEALVTRLRNRGFLIPDRYKFVSFTRGRHQKAANLLSWSLRWEERGEVFELGCRQTVSEFLRNGGIDVEWL